jgi:hypothetical protein
MVIVNRSPLPVTIKSISIRAMHHGTWVDGTHYQIATGRDTRTGEDCMLVKDENMNIVSGNWKFLWAEIQKRKVIEPGGVIEGSAVFLFDGIPVTGIRAINQIEVVTTDFSDNVSVETIPMTEEVFGMSNDFNFSLWDHGFTTDGKGGITFEEIP